MPLGIESFHRAIDVKKSSNEGEEEAKELLARNRSCRGGGAGGSGTKARCEAGGLGMEVGNGSDGSHENHGEEAKKQTQRGATSPTEEDTMCRSKPPSNPTDRRDSKTTVPKKPKQCMCVKSAEKDTRNGWDSAHPVKHTDHSTP